MTIFFIILWIVCGFTSGIWLWYWLYYRKSNYDVVSYDISDLFITLLCTATGCISFVIFGLLTISDIIEEKNISIRDISLFKVRKK